VPVTIGADTTTAGTAAIIMVGVIGTTLTATEVVGAILKNKGPPQGGPLLGFTEAAYFQLLMSTNLPAIAAAAAIAGDTRWVRPL
jgi:hypothetical protein